MKPDFTADEVAAWPVLVAPLSDEEAEAVAPDSRWWF